VIATRSVEQANAKRVFRSIQAYLDGERTCSRNWVLGVIGADIALANHLLLTRFADHRDTPRFRHLQSIPVRQTIEIRCECAELYAIEFETVLGVNDGMHFFSCPDCERRHVTPGVPVDALQWNERLGEWSRVALQSSN
jgi:hypothetical protein